MAKSFGGRCRGASEVFHVWEEALAGETETQDNLNTANHGVADSHTLSKK